MQSQNGMPVLATNRTTGDLPRLRKWVIPGANRHVYLRDGSVGFLLVHFALWWHESLHRLDGGVWDEWGWAVRPVRGQTTGYSNHASGSAIDLDATQHPRGVPILRTFKTFQVVKVRARIAFYRGALRWGGDYRSTVDGMHVELNTNLAGAEAQALRLLESPRGKRILAANPGAREVIVSGTPLERKPAPKPAPKPRPKPAPAPAKVRTRWGTANVNSGMTDAQARRAYAAAAAECDILLTQEDHLRQSAPLMPAGWATFQRPGGVSGRCSVHWRTALFDQVENRLLLLNEANGLTFPGARREAAVAVLKDKRNGKLVKPTSAHLVPHADDDHRAGVLTPMPRGKKAVIPAIESLVADSKAHPAAVELIGGDFNVDIDSDLRIRDNGLVERMHAARFVSDIEALGATPDTHGTQEYDHLYAKGVRWIAHKTLPTSGSDHHPKVATVEY